MKERENNKKGRVLFGEPETHEMNVCQRWSHSTRPDFERMAIQMGHADPGRAKKKWKQYKSLNRR